MDKINKLSQAIRLGIKFSPQYFGGGYFNYDNKAEIIAACTLGRAILALGYTNDHKLLQRFPELESRQKHPVTGRKDQLHCIIVDLNDEYKWTSGKIADWLDRENRILKCLK